MDLQLLFDLVGSATLALILVTGVLATGCACFLSFKVRQEKLLHAFTPICFLPSVIALLATLNSVMTGISIQLQTNQSDLQISTTTRLLMHATPLIVGLAASTPALILTCGSRFVLIYRDIHAESDESQIAESSDEPSLITPAEQITRDADEYLEKLIRPR
ncbi:MAG TPA: hypothetical protein DEF45_19720 [Rhodopirellula sp.]|nr:hypothetical protein [Rhodopirellula sp.]